MTTFPLSNRQRITNGLDAEEGCLTAKEELLRARRKSLRKGVWFQALTRAERGIIDLTLKYVDRVRSKILNAVLRKILRKLSYAVDHFFTWRLELIGRPIAEMQSRAAVALGLKSAEKWSNDRPYIQLLGLHQLGRHP